MSFRCVVEELRSSSLYLFIKIMAAETILLCRKSSLKMVVVLEF